MVQEDGIMTVMIQVMNRILVGFSAMVPIQGTFSPARGDQRDSCVRK